MKSAIVSSASSLLLIIIVGLQTALILRPHYAEAAASVSSKSNNNAAAAAATADDDTLENKLATLLSNKDSTAQLLSEKSAEYAEVQAAFHDKLAKFKSRQSELQAKKGNGSANHDAAVVEAVHENMDAVSLKLMQLIKRTEDVTRKVGEFNKAALLQAVNENEGGGRGGLEERLTNVMRHEIERRHRLDEMRKQAVEKDGAADDNTTEAAAERGTEYMTLEQLDELFTRDNIIQPTDNELKQKLKSLAIELMDQRTTDDEEFWKKYFATTTHSSQQKSKSNSDDDDECIGIASAVELVGNALASHYYDGGTNMVDVASYEKGGSVCYELTSAPYQPPPRNGNNPYQQAPSQVDKETEGMYYDQQLHDDDGAAIDKVDIWDWYTNFKLDGMRKYLPDDWERLFDKLSSSTSNTNWGEYTPRGVIDALIPDYVYHAFGIANTVSYGSVYGRTASPEVAIQAGYSKVGGGGGGSGGWSPKVLGNCYPLSMRPENDPILSIMSRHTHMEGGAEVIDEDADTSLLVGPKYTVRLPYSIHIDAVSIEHRSFPLPQSALANGVSGGESAPRWVKVVGFPPCKEEDDDDGNHLIEGEDDGCDKLGFDMNQPIDLGSFEYHPVTVSGREDDYGGGEDSDESSRRSVQTFAVKGGKLNSDDVEEDNGSETHSDEPDLEVEYEIPAGSCAPPAEPDEIPSCGGDDTSSSSFSGKSERQLVSAVSFIIEENWGNIDYTCLYRVQVHGDPIAE